MLPCVCCREELNRHLTVVLSILKGCVAYLPMWEGDPAMEEGWWVWGEGGGAGGCGGRGWWLRGRGWWVGWRGWWLGEGLVGVGGGAGG